MGKIKITLEWDGDQDKLGMDDNFDLVDTLIYMMDYDIPEPDGVVHDSHNGIKLTLVREDSSSLSSSSPSAPTAQECLENISDAFDDFCRNAQEFIDKTKEKQQE